ncbi:MAG TPA: LacI family DNA-binding transcriptional regulator [Propionibacteriaceae bacterium]|nr:LacI family DNA-binding transcriptional regulator [Propionibacteriaceae bacterium]
MPERRATVDDVARLAGVSRATVSYVLNDHPHQKIPETTRDKVRKAAATLEYTPLASARMLSRGRSDVVVMLIPDLPLGAVVPAIMDSVAEAIAPEGLELFLHRSRPGRDIKKLWNAISPAAVIRLGSLGPENDASLRKSRIGFLVELADSELEPGIVLFPGIETGRLQVQHLAERGHRRIGYAWPEDERLKRFARARLQGVQQACAELGLDEPVVEQLSFTAASASASVEAWRRKRVDGICAFNDELALVLMRAAQLQNVQVPAELAFVGVDDLPQATLSVPALSTVAPQPDKMGRFVARELLAGLAGLRPHPEDPTETFLQLVARDSA